MCHFLVATWANKDPISTLSTHVLKGVFFYFFFYFWYKHWTELTICTFYQPGVRGVTRCCYGHVANKEPIATLSTHVLKGTVSDFTFSSGINTG